MAEVSIEEIETLLDEERAALLAGDFDRLGEIAEEKEALADNLSRVGPSGEFRSLRAKAMRNADLLEAASTSIRGVTRRLAEIRKANGPLKTYGQDGMPRTLGPTDGSFEKRA